MVFEGHKKYISDVTELSGNTVLSSSGDQTFRVWNLDSRQQEVIIYPLGTRIEIDSYIVKQDLNLLITWEKTGEIGIWDLKTGDLNYKKYYECESLYPGLIDLDGSYFVTSGYSYTKGRKDQYSIWDANTGEKLSDFDEFIIDACRYKTETAIVWENKYSESIIKISIINFIHGHYLKTIDIVAASVSGVRVLSHDLIVFWLEDFRLLVFNEQLEVIQTLSQPVLGVFPKVIDPLNQKMMSDEQLLTYLNEPTGEYIIRYHNPNQVADATFDVSSQFKKIDLMQVDCISTATELNVNQVLISSCHGEFLLWDKLSDYLRPLDAQSIPTLENLELWSGHSPRKVILSGGYLPNQALTQLIPLTSTVKKSEVLDETWDSILSRSESVRVTTSGDLIHWDWNNSQSLSVIKRDGDVLLPKESLLDLSTDEHFLNIHPLVAPDGSLYRFKWPEEKLVPLINPTTAEPIRVSISTRRFIVNHYWNDNNQIAMIDGSDIVFWDTQKRQVAKRLYAVFDSGVRGITKGDDGCVIAWSRSDLASWSADYKPIYRLKDPTDWSSGYGEVVPLEHGGVMFFSGRFSMDNRITLWNGLDQLNVVQCHDHEIGGLLALNDNKFLSWADEKNISLMSWQIIP